MKHLAIVVVAATLLGLGIAPKALAGQDKACSNSSLRGSFGYSSTGTLLDSYVPPPFAGPFAEVGRQSKREYGWNRNPKLQREHQSSDHSRHIFGECGLYRLDDALHP